jgi:hypothetical protein
VSSCLVLFTFQISKHLANFATFFFDASTMSATSIASQINLFRKAISSYYLLPIFIIGMGSSIVNIIIFARRKLRSNVCSWYFICVSLAQILLLFFSGLYRTIVTGWSNGFDLTQTSSGLCKFRGYGFLLSLALSRYFLCLVSLDRWMKTSRSAWLRQKSSPKVARWLIGQGVLFWMLFTIHALFGFQIVPIVGCTPMANIIYGLFFSISTIVINIVPFVLMGIFCLLILKNVRKRGRAINPATMEALRIGTDHPRQSRTDFQLIRLSIAQSIFFLIFNCIPSVIPLYSFLTRYQVKNADQQAIEGLINDMGTAFTHTFTAVSIHPCYLVDKKL